ncbi:MAG TPA: hypothetical protein VGU66_16740 [Candidatus Elarobacter sp.]|nr:hypothetical protein [Candidatus Elarobacter sp.]
MRSIVSVINMATAVMALIVAATGCATADAGNVGIPVGCQSRFLGLELKPNSAVQLLVAAGNTVPKGAWSDYRDLALHVVRCTGADATLALRPINARSFSERALSTETVPSRMGRNSINPLHYRVDMHAFITRQTAQIDRLEAYPNPLDWSDPVGGLLAASDSLRHAPADVKRVVVMVMNGYEQTAEFNTFVFGVDPVTFAGPVLRKLREKSALPQLAGVDVVILGITQGAVGMHATTTQAAGVCRFWSKIVTAGKGNLVYCDAGLPDASRSD